MPNSLASGVLLADYDAIGIGLGFAALCVSMSAYYCVAEWRKVREAQLEADLKRDLVQKELSADDIERILNASAPRRP